MLTNIISLSNNIYSIDISEQLPCVRQYYSKHWKFSCEQNKAAALKEQTFQRGDRNFLKNKFTICTWYQVLRTKQKRGWSSKKASHAVMWRKKIPGSSKSKFWDKCFVWYVHRKTYQLDLLKYPSIWPEFFLRFGFTKHKLPHVNVYF